MGEEYDEEDIEKYQGNRKELIEWNEEYDEKKEECEHNRPFWECEICGNIRIKKEEDQNE